MSRDTDRGGWRVTTDHQRITTWADEHDAVPVRVDQSGGERSLDITTDPGSTSGEQLSWDQFFERFEAEQLAFRYREGDTEGDQETAELVDREGASDRTAADEKVDDPDDTETEQIGASDTGEGEPVVFDAVESGGGDDTDEETAMSESARGAEAAALVLDEIYEDPSLGSDPEEEYLVFRNDGEQRLDLSGWTVTNDAGQSYAFPDGFTLASGDRVTLHSGHGADTETELYWGAGESVWDKSGDTVTVATASGRRVLREPYKAG